MADYADSLATIILGYWRPKRIKRIELQEYQESLDELPTYNEYIQSDEWKEKSRNAKERAKYRCQLCNKKGNDSTLHTHHNTYDRLLLEDDTDLIVLCNGCHKKHHGIELENESIFDEISDFDF